MKDQGYQDGALRKLRQEVLKEHTPFIINDIIQLGFFPCGKCFVCNLQHNTGAMNIIGDEMVYNGRYTNCQTTNIIYNITCTKCESTYIGETGRSLQHRMSQHLASIRLCYDTTIAQHFMVDHDVNVDLSCGILSHNPNWSVVTRKERESNMIKKCNSLSPNGLNISKGKQLRRTVVPYVGVNMRNHFEENVTIAYRNGKNMKRKLVMATKEKINST